LGGRIFNREECIQMVEEVKVKSCGTPRWLMVKVASPTISRYVWWIIVVLCLEISMCYLLFIAQCATVEGLHDVQLPSLERCTGMVARYAHVLFFKFHIC